VRGSGKLKELDKDKNKWKDKDNVKDKDSGKDKDRDKDKDKDKDKNKDSLLQLKITHFKRIYIKQGVNKQFKILNIKRIKETMKILLIKDFKMISIKHHTTITIFRKQIKT
jgi:hypothetical protein